MKEQIITLGEPDPRFIMSAYEDGLREREMMGLGDEWHYQPTGWIRNDFHDKLIDIIGDENQSKFVNKTSFG